MTTSVLSDVLYPRTYADPQDWFPYQSNITLSRYAFELSEVFTHERIMKNFPGMAMHLFAHSPDAVRRPYAISRAHLEPSTDRLLCPVNLKANPWDFFPLNNWRDKKQDAVLFGCGCVLPACLYCCA